MQVGNRVGTVIGVLWALSLSGVAHAQGASPPAASATGTVGAAPPTAEVTTRPPTVAPATDESTSDEPPTAPAAQGAHVIRPGQPGVAESHEGVPVWMEGEDGATAVASIYPDWAKPGTVPPLFTCQLPCSLKMERGRYRIEVAETESTLRGNRPVTIEGPSRLVITPRDRSTRSVGLGLGIAGIVAVVTGVILVVVEVVDDTRIECNSDFCRSGSTNGGLATAGVVMFLAGAAATPIGWVMFGKSLRPAIDVQQSGQAAAPRGVLGLIGVPGGAGLGAKLTF